MVNPFSQIPENTQKAIAVIAFDILHGHETRIGMLAQRYKINPNDVVQILQALQEEGICGGLVEGHQNEEDPPIVVIPRAYSHLSPNIMWLFNKYDVKESDIKEALCELPREKKNQISNILTRNDGRTWIETKLTMPDVGDPVVIRFMSKEEVYAETDIEIIYAEDLKVGKWTGEKWEILGPHPKYDMSPISDHEKLTHGAVVTHWAKATPEEIKDWEKRFRLINDFKYLSLKVDPEHEEEVYMALITAASFIARYGGDDYEKAEPHTMLRKKHEILCDLMTCIDRGCALSNSGPAEGSGTDAMDEDRGEVEV